MKRANTLAEIVRERMEKNPKLAEAVNFDRLNSQIARQVRELRESAGFSQRELAGRVGTTQSVISRIEDAAYEGRSLSLLQRIATALKTSIRVEFRSKSEPVKTKRANRRIKRE